MLFGAKKQAKCDRQCVVRHMVNAASILDRAVCKDEKMSYREDPLVRNKLKIELSKLLGNPGAGDIKEIDARYPNMEGMLEKRFHDVNNIIKNCLEGEDEELVSITLNVVKGTLKH